MHPVLLKIGKISIFSYGFCIAVGFVVAIALAKKEARRVNADPDAIMDLSFYIILAALIGSRLFYVVTTPETFLSDPLEIFKIWNGGLVFYGGFIFALITALAYMFKKQMNVWQTADILAPVVPLGQFFGRIGCFLAGCCFGKVCDLPWAVTFAHPESLAPTGIPLHPSQLYHAAGNLMIFLFLWCYRKHKVYNGQLLWLYVTIYGAVRAFLEIFRGDFRGHVFFNVFSISQVVGGCMAVLGIVMMIILGKKNKAMSTQDRS